MRPLTAAVVLFALAVRLPAAEPIATDVQKAAERSLAFLAKDGLTWKETRKCASCHHIPFTLWSLNEARRAGYGVDEKILADLTAFSVAADDRAKVVVKRPPTVKHFMNQGALLLALGLQAGEVRDGAARERVDKAVALLLTEQTADGAWRQDGGRPPISAGPGVMTTLTLLGLPQNGEKNKETKAARERALKWLATATPGDDVQALALRVVLRQRLGGSSKELQALAKQIVSRQNSDGGWSQTKAMASDAYATGQALYALTVAGVGDAQPQAPVKKGQAFLVKTQRPDGSWPMTSRPMNPPGNTPQDRGAKNLSPITHAGTAWGTIGLVRSAPKSAIKETSAKGT
jgi:hypothetical protein